MSEDVSYKKKPPKDFRIFLARMMMVKLYQLSDENIKALFEILHEPELDDFDFEGILDQDRRIREVFGVPDEYADRQIFSENYGTTLRIAVEQARIWSN